MNKSTIFNHHGLMKRRYSVPETVMRKHTLQENLLRKHSSLQSSATNSPPPINVKDESCQTEELGILSPRDQPKLMYPVKKNSKSKRRRESVCCFRKSNSYSQYRSLSMFHKRAIMARHRDIHSLGSFDSSHTRAVSCETEKSMLRAKLNYSEDNKNQKINKETVFCTVDHSDVASSKRLESGQKYYSKSIDQTTNGYNTLHGSRNDTAQRKTPEPKSLPRRSPDGVSNADNQEPKHDNLFPITFNSESIFLHPYQKGYLSHKELHHISIQVVPDNETERPAANEYYKTEVKLNANEAGKDTRDTGTLQTDAGKTRDVNKSRQFQSKSNFESKYVEESIPLSTDTSELLNLSPNDFKTIEDEKAADITEIKVPNIILTHKSGQDNENAYSGSSHAASKPPSPNSTIDQILEDSKNGVQDCSVPTNSYLIKSGEQRLKIEVDTDEVDLPNSLQDIFLGYKLDKKEYCAERRKLASEYNSKVALRYLFQKLGYTYPGFSLPAKIIYSDYPQHGYDHLDSTVNNSSKLHPRMQYNNQTYDILSDSLVPSERSIFPLSPIRDLDEMKKLTDTNEHSDSDISIPDSLEDFQQTKEKYDKYRKYDEKLARGDVTNDLPQTPKTNTLQESISYFLSLEDNPSKVRCVDIPSRLNEKLKKHKGSVSRHIHCFNKHKKQAENPKQIHKQIQTCLNLEESLKKRRKRQASAALKSEQSSDLDERITSILMTGLKLQERENKIPIEKANKTEPHMNPSESENDSNLYEVINEEDIGRINSTNYYRTFKKSKSIYYPSKFSTECKESKNIFPLKFHSKLSELKQQMGVSNPTEGKGNTNIIAENFSLPYTKMRKREKFLKMKNVSKIPGPRNSHRFRQQFEAIPEEISNGSFDINRNSTEIEEEGTKAGDMNGNVGKITNGYNRAMETEINNTAEAEIDKKSQITEVKIEEGMNSRKARDSLYGNLNQEELITLSKGWINFYLLKGNNTEDNRLMEECRDENTISTETFSIPQEYSIHVHATPEVPKCNPLFPGLCKSSDHPYGKQDKLKKVNDASLPKIGNVANSKYTAQVYSKLSPKLNLLPRVRSSSRDSGGLRQKPEMNGGDSSTSPAERVKNETIFGEKTVSAITTDSNHSESPVSDDRNRNDDDDVQRHKKPTNGSIQKDDDWLLKVEGSHRFDEKNAVSDIQMQLCLKNKHDRQNIVNQHSWQFTVRSQNSSTSGITRSGRNRSAKYYLPHLNIDCKMLPLPNYENSVTCCSDNNSRSSSICSFKERKYSKSKYNANVLTRSRNKSGNDFKFLIKSDDELTVTGSTITPQRKSRVPNMSERDLTRMRLIKPTRDCSPL